jgi:hypothetical protein
VIDAILDDLFDALFLGPSGPLIKSRMDLKPDREAASYFITPARPRLTREDMLRPHDQGLIAGLDHFLDDLPAAQRGEMLDKVARIVEALSGEPKRQSTADLPDLVYVLH